MLTLYIQARQLQQLLAVLVKNAGHVLSRAALTDALWEGGEELNENALSVTVSRLRGRLGEKASVPFTDWDICG